MARIYDNLETKFTEGLQGIISNVGVRRVDFCVGYFNLRGWNLIVNQVDELPGDYIYEADDRRLRICRLLLGMHRPDEELIRGLYSKKVRHPTPNMRCNARCKLPAISEGNCYWVSRQARTNGPCAGFPHK